MFLYSKEEWFFVISTGLNQHTIKDKILLLLIGEVIDKIKDVRYFNKLDLIWNYNNVCIKEKKLFDLKVMYFGLCNFPEIFQKMINSIF